MKRILLVGLLSGLLAGCTLLELPVVEAAQVDMTWDYNYADDPACATTTSVDCVDGFEVMRGGTVVLVVPNPANATGFIAGIAATIFIGPPYGQVTVSVVAVGRDPNGGRVLSLPATASVFIRPSPPSNVRGVNP